jgi:aminomethyltransferase
MKKTPLSAVHEAANARMTDFGGWYLPVQYEGILAEHKAVREHCGIFDTCHMGRIRVSGRDAASALSSALTIDACALRDGRCRYGFMLNERGGIIDDLIVYRSSQSDFMVVTNSATFEKDFSTLRSRIPGGTAVEDIAIDSAKVDVQGPESPAIMKKLLNSDVSDMPYFGFRKISFDGIEAVVSRTGYTGETGYEVYMPASRIASFWQSAVRSGAAPCGLGSRDTLRLEAGLPLYGHELTEETTPLDAGFMRYISLSRSFTGSSALRQLSEEGPSARLTPFTIDGRQSARSGNRIVVDGADAGWVTSGSFAPSLGHCIGFAYVKAAALESRKTFGIDTGRKIIDACIAGVPFYKK